MAKKKAEKTEGNICVVYARYSSHAQNDASIEQQVAECREYAAAHDLKISEIYADRAISGRSDRRPYRRIWSGSTSAHWRPQTTN